ncbi:MAG: response regulator [Cyclobacteriaceae bacterium]|nr:response regulator [Cyclobacteriaceae bacterium SS2]
MTRILVVEDEAIIAADLNMILTKRGYTCDQTDNAIEALELIAKNDYQLFLMDIFISGDTDGVDLARQIRKRNDRPLLFLTSYYDNQTLDRVKEIKPEAYIVKPFEERNLIANIELALYRHKRPVSSSPSLDKIFVKDQSELVALDPTDITYVEADDNYARVVANSKTYLLSHPIKKVEENLGKLPFARVHKSFIVNLTKVTSIQEGFVFLGTEKIPLGRTYRQPFMSALTIL